MRYFIMSAKTISLLILIIMAATLVAWSSSGARPGAGPFLPVADFPIVGVTAPAFSLPSLSGAATISLDAYHGRPVIINFWTTWCGVCVHELPLFEKFYAQYHDQVGFIAVCSGKTEQEAKELIKKNGITFPVAYDAGRKIAGIYQPPRPRDTRRIIAFPFTVFVNKDGTVVYARIGAFVTIDKLITLLQQAGIQIKKEKTPPPTLPPLPLLERRGVQTGN